MNVAKIKWPPYTCVSCFVFYSLEHYGIYIDPKLLSKDLAINVPRNSENPFGLSEVINEEDFGLRISEAKKNIDKILKQASNKLSFRHIPFESVPYAMYEELAEDLLRKNIPIGVGFNYNVVHQSNQLNKHVSFLKDVSDGFYLLNDFFSDEELKIEKNKFVRSVFSINDGFWIISAENIQSPFLNKI